MAKTSIIKLSSTIIKLLMYSLFQAFSDVFRSIRAFPEVLKYMMQAVSNIKEHTNKHNYIHLCVL